MSPVLVLGGIYLCFEGAHTILEKMHLEKEPNKLEKQAKRKN